MNTNILYKTESVHRRTPCCRSSGGAQRDLLIATRSRESRRQGLASSGRKKAKPRRPSRRYTQTQSCAARLGAAAPPGLGSLLSFPLLRRFKTKTKEANDSPAAPLPRRRVFAERRSQLGNTAFQNPCFFTQSLDKEPRSKNPLLRWAGVARALIHWPQNYDDVPAAQTPIAGQ